VVKLERFDLEFCTILRLKLKVIGDTVVRGEMFVELGLVIFKK
jgi:hypothetical protein